MSSDRPITEDDLHGYVDGALDPARGLEVETYLARSPEIAQRVAAFARQRRDLRAALGPIAAEPVPPQLNLARWTERRAHRGRWQMAAAAAILLCIGSTGGWIARDIWPRASGLGGAALAQEAADSFRVFSTDQVHAVEFKANDRTALVDWVSARLRRPVAVPDLAAAGYRFMGGRLIATPHGPAGLFMYDDDHGGRIAMLVRPMAEAQDVRMTQHRADGIDGFAWGAKGLGYSLVGAADPDILHPLANEARRQIANTL